MSVNLNSHARYSTGLKAVSYICSIALFIPFAVVGGYALLLAFLIVAPIVGVTVFLGTLFFGKKLLPTPFLHIDQFNDSFKGRKIHNWGDYILINNFKEDIGVLDSEVGDFRKAQ